MGGFGNVCIASCSVGQPQVPVVKSTLNVSGELLCSLYVELCIVEMYVLYISEDNLL